MIFGRETRISTQRELEEYIIREQKRNQNQYPVLSAAVAEIVSEMRNAEGAAQKLDILATGIKRFDAPNATSFEIIREPKETKIEPKFKLAIDKAIDRVINFHKSQYSKFFSGLTTIDHHFEWKTIVANSPAAGSEGQIIRAMKTAGVYIPGGRASYPSTAIMNLGPAKAAGVEELYVASPMMPDGTVLPAVEYVCWKLGVKKMVLAGGAYGISALALGIEGELPPVDVIVGPGNRFVNEAKRLFWGQVGLDGLAGPSEIALVMDEEAHPKWCALDLLAQIEHAPDNVPRLYCLNESLFETIAMPAIEEALKLAPRSEAMRSALKNEGEVVIFPRDGLDQKTILQSVGDAINAFAPEHLSIQILRPHALLPYIRNAGSISIGPYSAQSFGDYATGHSHTIPTGGASRFGSPVNIFTFMKISSLSEIDKVGADELADIAETLGELEGFPTHAICARTRKEIN